MSSPFPRKGGAPGWTSSAEGALPVIRRAKIAELIRQCRIIRPGLPPPSLPLEVFDLVLNQLVQRPAPGSAPRHLSRMRKIQKESGLVFSPRTPLWGFSISSETFQHDVQCLEALPINWPKIGFKIGKSKSTKTFRCSRSCCAQIVRQLKDLSDSGPVFSPEPSSGIVNLILNTLNTMSSAWKRFLSTRKTNPNLSDQ